MRLLPLAALALAGCQAHLFTPPMLTSCSVGVCVYQGTQEQVRSVCKAVMGLETDYCFDVANRTAWYSDDPPSRGICDFSDDKEECIEELGL